jgi:hypothetical protein
VEEVVAAVEALQEPALLLARQLLLASQVSQVLLPLYRCRQTKSEKRKQKISSVPLSLLKVIASYESGSTVPNHVTHY